MRRKGFTMLEILTSLIIIATLAAVLLPRFETTKAKVNQRDAESCLRAIRIAQKQYYASFGAYACSTACSGAAAINTAFTTTGGGGGGSGIAIKDGAFLFTASQSEATAYRTTPSKTITINYASGLLT